MHISLRPSPSLTSHRGDSQILSSHFFFLSMQTCCPLSTPFSFSSFVFFYEGLIAVLDNAWIDIFCSVCLVRGPQLRGSLHTILCSWSSWCRAHWLKTSAKQPDTACWQQWHESRVNTLTAPVERNAASYPSSPHLLFREKVDGTASKLSHQVPP